MSEQLEMWTVYKHPKDHPDKYVARKFVIEPLQVIATNDMFVADSLEEIRLLLPDQGLHCLPRYENDDPNIVEVWL